MRLGEESNANSNGFGRFSTAEKGLFIKKFCANQMRIYLIF